MIETLTPVRIEDAQRNVQMKSPFFARYEEGRPEERADEPPVANPVRGLPPVW